VRYACLIVVFLVGCRAQLGGPAGDDDSEVRPDAMFRVTPDAAVQPDATPVVADNTCGVASDYGTLGSLAGQADYTLQNGSTTDYVTDLSAATPMSATQAAPDILLIELWDNFGVFNGGPAKTGTFQITGDETDYDTCGACVLLLANYTSNAPTKLLLATAGTVTVTSVGTASGQMTKASIANATFVEIAYDAATGYSTVAGSTCPSPITSAALSGTLP
jgi:hypothetical protein